MSSHVKLKFNEKAVLFYLKYSSFNYSYFLCASVNLTLNYVSPHFQQFIDRYPKILEPANYLYSTYVLNYIEIIEKNLPRS